MLPGKLVEILLQDPDCQPRFLRLLAFLQLQQQTFLQIACADACRIQILYYSQDFLHFLILDIQSGLENQVIGNRREVATEVAVIIYVSDNIFSNLFVLFR